MRALFAVTSSAIALAAFAGDLAFLEFFGPLIVLPLALLSFSLVGSFLVVRRAGDPIGWLLAAAGVAFEILLVTSAYGYASLVEGRPLPAGDIAVWYGSVTWIAALGLVVAAMVLFPDGRVPGRGLGILLWLFAGFTALFAFASAFADQPLVLPQPFVIESVADERSIPNPLALPGAAGAFLAAVAEVARALFPILLIAPAALVARFRRSRGVEREQLKWLTYDAALAFGLFLASILTPRGLLADLLWAASVVAIGLLPVAIGVAVTRYRLYEIDVLIRRTLVYAAVSAVLVTAYVGGVGFAQFALARFTAGSDLAIAISTLLVVALFQPVRRRVQRAVDRRFYRAAYDAERTLDVFAQRLADQLDLEALTGELVAVVDEAVRPRTLSVWLRRNDARTARG